MSIDLANVPHVPIQIGVAGENSFRTITFDASKWGADYPDATYTVVYRRSDGYLYPVLVNASADAIVWSPTETDTAVSGNGQLEVRLLDGETIGKTIIMQTYLAPSLSGDESEPSRPAPDWVNDVADDADRAEAAVTHYPKIINGVWFVWDATASEFVSTGISAQGEDGVSPTVTVSAIDGGHRVTITDASGDHTFDVMDGEGGGGGSSTVIVTVDDTTDPMTASMNATQIKAAVDRGERVVLSVDGFEIPYQAYLGSVAVFSTVLDAEAGNPTCITLNITTGGTVIPSTSPIALVTDIPTQQQMAAAAPVQSVNGQTGAVTIPIPTVPQMATQADMSDWTSGKTVDAATLKNDLEIALALMDNLESNKADKTEIPSLTGYATETWVEGKGYQTAQEVQTAISGVRQLPAVAASDNGKFLRVVNGTWAAQTVPSAESNSFGGGA